MSTTTTNTCTCLRPPRPVLEHPDECDPKWCRVTPTITPGCGHVTWWHGDHRFAVTATTVADGHQLVEVGVARNEDGIGGVYGDLEVHVLFRATGEDDNSEYQMRISPAEARALASLLSEQAHAVEFYRKDPAALEAEAWLAAGLPVPTE
jgi:hypothetical protein